MDLSFMCNYCDATTMIVGILTFLVLVWLFKTRRPKGYPPGPTGLPLVGYAPFLGSNPGESLMKLKKKYGPVMSVQMGSESWVVLNDYETVHEALVKQGEIFSGRPNNYVFQVMTNGRGLVMADYGATWKSLRKFGLMTLRGFGVGKKGMEENVIEETTYLVESLATEGTDLRHKLTVAVSNIICRVVFGSRFEHDDKNFAELIRAMNEFFSDSFHAKMLGVIFFAPSLRHLPVFRGSFEYTLEEVKKFLGLLQEFVDQHKSTFVKNDLRDFIDAFLKEIEEKGKDDPSFNEKDLLQYIRDLFEAGTGTTSSTLLWSLFTFAHFPETQEKIAREVESVIGDSGTPTMRHKDQMPYTCAFIQEIMRLKTLLPLSVFHKTSDNAVLHGYTIPKNTTIAPNLWAVHHDPEVFVEPEVFRPERFLDQNGNFIRSNHVIPFSVGPRHCLGEQLARMEVFIFLTSIVQKLRLRVNSEFPLPSYDSGHSNGITFEGPAFEVIFEKR